MARRGHLRPSAAGRTVNGLVEDARRALTEADCATRGLHEDLRGVHQALDGLGHDPSTTLLSAPTAPFER
ncbi:hypothetical protein [Embleya hyalina]|uniref:Uncharacterized protein n=1 Tax=Embleya hyalina TaxID=516124 RepID=A0A401Z3Y6_9ACTN|nr:hypothetical protein [Embleya hyalina]GCE01561.1 hypothetical protein EHYA_09327 [Embleya hyalina]